MNTHAQAQPTYNISDLIQHIAEIMMVEIKQTTSGILGEIFCMETLFPEYAK